MKKASKFLSLVLAFVFALAPAISLAIDSPYNITETNDMVNQVTGLNSVVGSVIGLLKWAGYAIAVIMVVYMGIQWMLAQPAKKAELKGKMWSVAIGIVLLVGGTTILDFVWNAVANSGL